jgi:hypothetical protein
MSGKYVWKVCNKIIKDRLKIRKILFLVLFILLSGDLSIHSAIGHEVCVGRPRKCWSHYPLLSLMRFGLNIANI